MSRFSEFDNILDRYEKTCLVEIYSAGAGKNGTSERGIIVTTDKRMLAYSVNIIRSKDMKYDISIDYDKVIDDKKFKKINNFLNKKIIGKNYEDIIMFDMSFVIIGNGFKIRNHRDLYDELRKIIEK